MRARFNYDPMKDRLLPCKETGLPFEAGDVLEIVNSEDPNWWQVIKLFVPVKEVTLDFLYCVGTFVELFLCLYRKGPVLCLPAVVPCLLVPLLVLFVVSFSLPAAGYSSCRNQGPLR